MDDRENELILSFDTIYTTNHIQMLKVLLPLFDPGIQKKMAVMIKYLEFQYTLDYFRQNPDLPGALCSPEHAWQREDQKPDIIEIFSRIKAFCTPPERAMFDQLANLKQNMERYEEMMRMMQMFSEFSGAFEGTASQPPSPDDAAFAQTAGNAEGGLNPMDLLKTMLTPEQQSMFDMFAAAFPDRGAP